MNVTPHRTPVRVLYADVDLMQFAYYGRYLRWFELGRAEFMRHRGLPYSEVEKRGIYLPVSEAYCKYQKPIRYDELIWIEAWPEECRRVRARFAYRILSEREETMATGYTVHFSMDAEGNVVRMPPFLVEVIAGPSPLSGSPEGMRRPDERNPDRFPP